MITVLKAILAFLKKFKYLIIAAVIVICYLAFRQGESTLLIENAADEIKLKKEQNKTKQQLIKEDIKNIDSKIKKLDKEEQHTNYSDFDSILSKYKAILKEQH